jgi:hypothetical protein
VATPLERLIPFRKLQGAASLLFDARKLAHNPTIITRYAIAVRVQFKQIHALLKKTGQ